MKKLLLPLLLLAVACLLPVAAAAEPLAGKVLWIYDGDTIKVEEVGKVRLIGIDTPEKESSRRDDYYLRQGISQARLRQTYGDALQFMIANVKGKQVSLETDQEVRDRHGRLLAYVYLPDGTLLNELLLEKGLAAVYRKFNFRLKRRFLGTEDAARANAAGLWSGHLP